MIGSGHQEGVYLIENEELKPLFTADFNVRADGESETEERMHAVFDEHGVALVDESFLEPLILLEGAGLEVVKVGSQ